MRVLLDLAIVLVVVGLTVLAVAKHHQWAKRRWRSAVEASTWRTVITHADGMAIVKVVRIATLGRQEHEVDSQEIGMVPMGHAGWSDRISELLTEAHDVELQANSMTTYWR